MNRFKPNVPFSLSEAQFNFFPFLHPHFTSHTPPASHFFNFFF
ncbi:hypothetical protein MtrunA17_Chr4g0001171 [Medicago truncatula]|uniref:Uncharacterized protein n=1 Tax=Medicago truncatula TaxID=3880 RepID=A0A396I0G1_MEDTR|nr:hypothetical protein MtrunA17_Chr4g0001171 [Medicago truncatula]